MFDLDSFNYLLASLLSATGNVQSINWFTFERERSRKVRK